MTGLLRGKLKAFLLIGTMFALMAAIACQGERGPAGPAGAPGNPGNPGAAGAPGAAGHFRWNCLPDLQICEGGRHRQCWLKVWRYGFR